MGRTNKIINAIDFIEYISKPVKQDDISLLYKLNNITPERTRLYLDFIHGLFDLVTTTYLGDDILSGKDIENHFKWCWNQTIKSFRKEKIYFLDDDELYYYFHSLFIESFYREENKSDDNINKLMTFWTDIFEYGTAKTMSELEALIDLYKIFDNSLYI